MFQGDDDSTDTAYCCFHGAHIRADIIMKITCRYIKSDPYCKLILNIF